LEASGFECTSFEKHVCCADYFCMLRNVLLLQLDCPCKPVKTLIYQKRHCEIRTGHGPNSRTEEEEEDCCCCCCFIKEEEKKKKKLMLMLVVVVVVEISKDDLLYWKNSGQTTPESAYLPVVHQFNFYIN
jgi:hypothetical protein